MNIYKNNEETSNTPTQRLSNEQIYRNIKYCVEQQVREMLSSDYYDWNNRNKYVENIYISDFSSGFLVCLNEKKPEEFIQQHAQQHEDVFSEWCEEEQLLREAFPRYVKIWEENWRVMVAEVGMKMGDSAQKELEFSHQLLAKNRLLVR